MNSNLNFSSLRPKLKKAWNRAYKHATFAAVLVVLLVYLLAVLRISQLANAEPTAEEEGNINTSGVVPKINKDAIKQIQQLEQNSPEVRSLFDEARNNPFQE